MARNQTITVSVRQNYGQEAIYPVCDAAKSFARIAGTRTLTREVLTHVRALGYDIEVQYAQVAPFSIR